MKILGICGSPREKGNTARIIRRMLNVLTELGADTEFIPIVKLKIEFCNACEHCMRQGKCIHEDDCEELMNKVLGANGLILGSPNYAFQMSAQMKALFDRSHCLLYYTRRLRGKYGAGVSVGAAEFYTKEVARFMAMGTWLCGGYSVGYVWGITKERDKPEIENESHVFSQADELAEKLFGAIRKKKRYRWQDIKRNLFIDRHLKAMVMRIGERYPYLFNIYSSSK